MSTVIIRNPEPFQPTKSDGLYFTVSADTASEPKFRFVYDVYVNGYKIYEGRATPNPYGLGVIDLSLVLDNYVQNYPVAYHDQTPIFAHQTSPFSKPYSNEVIEYYVQVGEEYADTFISSITGFTGIGNQVGLPSVPSDTFKAFLSTMGVNRRSTAASFKTGQFTLSGSPSPAFPNTIDCLFLTNSPRIRDISTDEYYTLAFTNGDLGSPYLSEPYYVEYNFYDDNGLLITSHTYSNIVSNGGGPATACTQDYVNDVFTGFTEYNILNLGAGPKNIYDFPANTSYYTIQLMGKAPEPSPTPTPTPSTTPGNTPSPTPTNTTTPTPSVTPSSTPCACNTYNVENLVGYTNEIPYVDCRGLPRTQYISAFQMIEFCACSVEETGTLLITNMGSCAGVTPTPTSTPGLSPTPTPSSTPSTTNAFLRDCCTGQIVLQGVVNTSSSIGNTIAISGDCFQVYAYGGTGVDGNFTTGTPFINCNECVANFPCAVDPDKPTIQKPDVQPLVISPSGGTAPCVSYSPVSEIFQFNVVAKCNPFGNDQIMFKNRYGAWDYFLFERARAEGLAIDRQTYGQYNVTWGSANPIKTNYSRGTTDFQTTINETHIVNSGFLNDPEFIWLEELYTTNDAYLINTDGTLFPIIINGTEFVKKTKGNRSITNIELTYSYANNIKLLDN